jgi:hypothetical protein
MNILLHSNATNLPQPEQEVSLIYGIDKTLCLEKPFYSPAIYGF